MANNKHYWRMILPGHNGGATVRQCRNCGCVSVKYWTGFWWETTYLLNADELKNSPKCVPVNSKQS